MLQPLKFIEFILEDVQQAVPFSGDRKVVATAPHPARYAVHKLLVYGERKGVFPTKFGRDLAQAGAFLMRMRDEREWEVTEAWTNLMGRGKGWRDFALRGRDALAKKMPALDLETWLGA